MEFVLSEQFFQAGQLGCTDLERFFVPWNVQIGPDGDQILGKFQHVFGLCDLFLHFDRQLGKVSKYVLYGSVTRYQVFGTDFSNAPHSRDVVRGVSPYGQDIGYL